MIIALATTNDIGGVLTLDALVMGNTSRLSCLQEAIDAHHLWVAQRDGRIAGYVIMEPASFFGQAFIELLIVHPNHRRQGVGRLLVRAVQSQIPGQKLFTSTNESNAAMRLLCESLGFVKSGYIENLDEGDPEIVYFKRVVR